MPRPSAAVVVLGGGCWPRPVTGAPAAAGLAQTQALRAELAAAACDVPTKLLVRGWRGHRADRGGDIDIIPQEPDFVGTGGLPHSGPWDYVAQVPLWLYGPGHIRARGEVDRGRDPRRHRARPRARSSASRSTRPTGRRSPRRSCPRRAADPPKLVVVVVWDGAGRFVLDAVAEGLAEPREA